MENNELRPNQAVNKAYLKQSVEEKDIVRFKNAMQKMLKNVNLKESEEHNKNLVMEFLSNAFYKDTRHSKFVLALSIATNLYSATILCGSFLSETKHSLLFYVQIWAGG